MSPLAPIAVLPSLQLKMSRRLLLIPALLQAVAAISRVPRAPTVVVLASFLGGALSKKAPTALEASYKDRITKKLNASLEAAAEHIVQRFGLGGGPFGGYELELQEETKGFESKKWLHSCSKVDSTRDTIENCAMRQLHALTALCDVDGFLDRSKAAATLVDGHLKALAKGEVPSLGIKRMKWDTVELWVHRKSPESSSDDVDASPALQASILMAVVRCADATGQRKYFAEAESWFVGLKKVYPPALWNKTLVSFHKSGIIWESLAHVDSHLPMDSTFHASLVQFIKEFEAFLSKAWLETPDTWSFATARALSLRWHSKALKGKKPRAHVRRWAQEHVDRFLGRTKTKLGDPPSSLSKGLLERIGGGAYTCGPLQGLTALAAVLTDAELIQVVLQLLEKDVDRYQLGPAKIAITEVNGGFARDEQQMKMEQRRSLRVDDSAMCMIALTQALKTLDTIVGVAVEADDMPSAAAAPADAADSGKIPPAAADDGGQDKGAAASFEGGREVEL